MKASKLDAHLNNPTLLQELIEKMGSDMMLNWAIHSKSEASTTSVLHSHRKTSSSNTDGFLKNRSSDFAWQASKSIDVYAFTDDGSTLTLMEWERGHELDERGTASPPPA
ncbi:hypothetical protein ACLKA7_000750 [Drosophila subpalustris]